MFLIGTEPNTNFAQIQSSNTSLYQKMLLLLSFCEFNRKMRQQSQQNQSFFVFAIKNLNTLKIEIFVCETSGSLVYFIISFGRCNNVCFFLPQRCLKYRVNFMRTATSSNFSGYLFFLLFKITSAVFKECRSSKSGE